MLSKGNNNTTTQFVSIVKGNFRVKVDERTEGAESRVNKNREKVWELVYSNLDGKIKDISIEDSQFGEKMKIKMSGGEILTLGTYTNEGIVFLKMLPNLYSDKELSFYCFLNKEGKTVFGIKQNGEVVKWSEKYRKEKKDFPAWEEQMRNGVKEWNKDKQVNYLKKDALEPFVKELESLKDIKDGEDEEYLNNINLENSQEGDETIEEPPVSAYEDEF